MKKTLCSIIVSIIAAVVCSAQAKIGEVACVYVTSSNLDSSLSFYQKLGFGKTNSNTFPSPWAQVSDGTLMIMIRQDKTPYIGLTYYVSDVDAIADKLEKAGILFTQKPKDGDQIKRYYFKSPDGLNIMLAGNLGGFEQPKGVTLLNMKSTDYNIADKYPNKLCGAFGEFCHPVVNIDASIDFWKKLGYELKSKMSEPYPHAILSDGLMLIGLHQTKDFNYPAVTYFGINVEARIKQLQQSGISGFSEMMGKSNQILNTWEGQHFFLFSMGF